MSESLERDFGCTTRTPERGFVARQRARGTPDAAIARMGGWCISDVRSISEPLLHAVERAPVAPVEPEPIDRLVLARDPDVADILRHISAVYLISPDDILGHSHAVEFVEPRHEAFAVVWELNRFTMAELAALFNKTPSGIAYGLQRHYERLRERGPGRDW